MPISNSTPPSTTTTLSVAYHGDQIDCVRDEQGQVLVAVKRICENLGLGYKAQLRKLQSAPWAVVTIMATTGSDGKTYQMACISIETLPMWLATVHTTKVPDELLRHKIEVYQREAAKVLWQHFGGGPVAADGHALQEMSEEVRQLQRQLIRLEQLVAPHGDPDAPIDSVQQALLKAKLLDAAERQGTSFGRLHGKLRADMRLPGYRFLTQRQYPLALDWVTKEALRVTPSPEQVVVAEIMEGRLLN